MRELGIEPPPKVQPIKDPTIWGFWDRWLQRLTNAVPKVQTFTETLNPTTVAANTTSEQTFTVTGLTTRDIVYVNKPSHSAGLGIGNARVSADNTLAITFVNPTGSGIDPPSEDYYITAIRR